MPRKCTICIHEARDKIDEALIIKQNSYRNISERFGVSLASLNRHKDKHIPAALVEAVRVKELTNSQNLIDQLNGLKRKAFDILDKAEEAQALPTALHAIREIRCIIELYAKLIGEIQVTHIHLHQSTEWIQMRTLILQAVEPFPQVKQRLVEVLS